MANNKLAYGLAKEHGIDTEGMTPGQVWEALKKAGISVHGQAARDKIKSAGYSDEGMSDEWAEELAKTFSGARTGTTKHIGTLDFSDKQQVISVIQEAERQFSELTYEACLTITADGKIMLSKGEEARIYIDIDNRNGAYSYHNHPKRVTNYSFSAEDVGDFLSSGEQYSAASDHLYSYSMERTPETIDADYDEIVHQFRKAYYKKVIPLAATSDLFNVDTDGNHTILEYLSTKYKFKYERRTKHGENFK